MEEEEEKVMEEKVYVEAEEFEEVLDEIEVEEG